MVWSPMALIASSDDDDEAQTLYRRVLSIILIPFNVATSRPAIKAYLSTLLFLAVSLVLLATSTTAYLLFYYNFVPQIGLERVIHLQYGDGPHPYAVTTLDAGALSSQQPYDISLELHLPRTPTNLAAGNFMLDLSLLAAIPQPNTNSSSSSSSSNTLAHSRRPAILPYQSPLLALAHTVIALPWHTLGLQDLDADTLSIPMFERVSFARGWRSLPTAARLELQSDQVLQVYSAKVAFRARFQGLRYILYNYRVLSFLLFTSAFYLVALTSASVAWIVISTLLSSSKPTTTQPQLVEGEEREEGEKGKRKQGTKQIKQEANGPDQDQDQNSTLIKTEDREEDQQQNSDEYSSSPLSTANLSDNATTFPTLGRQMPLRFPIPRRSAPSSRDNNNNTSTATTTIKREPDLLDDNDDNVAIAQSTLGPSAADDEDEDEEAIRLDNANDKEEYDDEEDVYHLAGRDSGIGTSMESEAATSSSRHQHHQNLLLHRRRSSNRSRVSDHG